MKTLTVQYGSSRCPRSPSVANPLNLNDDRGLTEQRPIPQFLLSYKRAPADRDLSFVGKTLKAIRLEFAHFVRFAAYRLSTPIRTLDNSVTTLRQTLDLNLTKHQSQVHVMRLPVQGFQDCSSQI